jgi:hypothetical protein
VVGEGQAEPLPWPDKASRLIATALCNRYDPTVVLHENKKGHYDVVDGKQRLTSLLGFFLNGEDNMPLEVDTRFREKMDNDVLQAKVFELERCLANDVLQAKVFELERCLANDVLQAKVFELEGQVEEMTALYNLKLMQENLRPSTPAFAPKDSESMLHHRRTQAVGSCRRLVRARLGSRSKFMN